MSDTLHLDKVRAGASVWNKWRRDNPSIVPDLTGLRISASELQFGVVQGGPVDFSRTELNNAVLVHATLIEANLAGAVLVKADLSYARLNKADLRGADLRGAKIGHADLTDARLDGAFVCGADLRHARGLTQQQIERALGGDRTLLPAGLEVPTTWLVEEERERQRPDGQGIDSQISEYDLLGVKPKASMLEIRTAWLRLVKELHPDIAADDPSANERLKAINRAYQGLKSNEQREMARRAQRPASGGAATFAVFLFLPIAATLAMAVWTHGIPVTLRDEPVTAVVEQRPTADDTALAAAMGQEADETRVAPALRYQPNQVALSGEVGTLPNSALERTDKTSDDDAAWANAAAEATTASLNRYLGLHPQGRHAQKAIDDLTQLAAVELALGEDYAVREAAAMQRAEPILRRYLLEYPTGPLAPEARGKLAALEAGTRAAVAWSHAEQEDSKVENAENVVAFAADDLTAQAVRQEAGRQELALAKPAEREPTNDPIAATDVTRSNGELAEQLALATHVDSQTNGRHAEAKLAGLERTLETQSASVGASTKHARPPLRTGRPVASTAHSATRWPSADEPFVAADGRIR